MSTTSQRRSKLAHALDHAAAGFKVFPLIPNDKRPLISGWQAKATTDSERIRDWWADEPNANIGLLTERMLVVDIDPRKGGNATMSEMRMLGIDFPNTVASVTAGGGAHLLFTLPDGTTLSGGNNLFGQGLDVKSHGGFIVAPGSTISNNAYAWVPSHAPGKIAMAAPADWMIEKCARPAERSADAGKAVVEEDDAAIARAEHWLNTNAPEAVEGERDNVAFTIAAKLYDFGVSPDTCRDLLSQWNETSCYPSLESDDIERLLRSAAKNRQTAIGAKHPDAPGFEVYEIDGRASPVVPKMGTDLPNEGKPRSRLYHLTYADAADQALTTATEPLIQDLLDRSTMSVLYGESNSGKTFVMLDIAWHVAAGLPWGPNESPTKKGTVVYVAAEGGRGILKRIRALKDRHPDVSDVALSVVPCPVDLLRADADLKPLVEEIRAIEAASGIPVEMVVIDTLSRAIAGGNENDSQDMGALVRHLDVIRAATKAHVAIVHHTGKDKAKGARGHSLLRAATDTEIEIDERTLTVTKQRDMEGGQSMQFRLKPIDLGTDPAGRPVKSCTVTWPAPGDADEPQTLNGIEKECFNALVGALKKRDNDDTTQCFDLDFFSDAVRNTQRFKVWANRPKAKSAGRHSLPRGTADDWLSELTEKGVVKKAGHGQWVTVSAGNAGNAEKVQDKMPEMPGTLRGRHSANPPAESTGQKEKTRHQTEAAAEFGI